MRSMMETQNNMAEERRKDQKTQSDTMAASMHEMQGMKDELQGMKDERRIRSSSGLFLFPVGEGNI
jgi:hypothetical protein